MFLLRVSSSVLVLCFLKTTPQYGIANIPPVVMFNAKIFKPSRLCAVYKVEGLSEDARRVLNERIQRLRYTYTSVAAFTPSRSPPRASSSGL